MTRSIEKAFATDLTETRQGSLEDAEARIAAAKALILNSFADGLPEVLEGYKQLALLADDEEVRRRASERILDTFLPPPQAKLQHAAGTTIQILNALPIPEVSMVNGKEQPMIEIGNTKFTIPTKRTITPAEEPKRRERFLGPAAMTGNQRTGATSPAPSESHTVIPKP